MFLPKGGILIFLNGFTHKTHAFNKRLREPVSCRFRPTTVHGESWDVSVVLGFRRVDRDSSIWVVCLQGGIKKVQRAEQVKMYKEGSSIILHSLEEAELSSQMSLLFLL